MDIGNAIRQSRREKNITQVQLSKMTKVSQASISQIESGEKRPRAATLKKICKAIGVSEVMLHLLSIERKDVPVRKQKEFDVFYEMLKKLITDMLN